jgi:hypothetical protein
MQGAGALSVTERLEAGGRTHLIYTCDQFEKAGEQQ